MSTKCRTDEELELVQERTCGERWSSSHANMSPNTCSTPSAGSPTSWCHIPGYKCKVLSLLPAFLCSILLPSGSHTTSWSPCKISNGAVTSDARLSISFTTRKNSWAVAARGLPVYLEFKRWHDYTIRGLQCHRNFINPLGGCIEFTWLTSGRLQARKLRYE